MKGHFGWLYSMNRNYKNCQRLVVSCDISIIVGPHSRCYCTGAHTLWNNAPSNCDQNNQDDASSIANVLTDTSRSSQWHPPLTAREQCAKKLWVAVVWLLTQKQDANYSKRPALCSHTGKPLRDHFTVLLTTKEYANYFRCYLNWNKAPIITICEASTNSAALFTPDQTPIIQSLQTLGWFGVLLQKFQWTHNIIREARQ